MLQSIPLTVIIGKDKMIKHTEVDVYIKMIDRVLEKGSFFSKFFGVV